MDYDLRDWIVDADGNGEINYATMSNGTCIFKTEFDWIWGGPGNISLTVKYKGNPANLGKLVVKACSLQTATVQYPVVIDGNSSTISLAGNTSIFDDVLLSLNEYSNDVWVSSPTEIGGYANALKTRFDASVHMRFTGGE